MRRTSSTSMITALAICLALSAGCAPTARVVEGKITLDGKALETGAVEFEPAESHGKILAGDIKDGSYRIDIPPNIVGKAVVRITSMRPTGRKMPAGPPAPKGTMM